jgi:hypothetical protein
MRLAPLLAAIGLALLTAACLPVTSKVPVGTSVGFKPDPRLLGTWLGRGKDEERSSYLHFLGAKDGTMVAILVSPPHGDNLGEWSEYRLRAATLGANHFINAQEIIINANSDNDRSLSREIIVLLYRTGRRGSLDLYLMDEKAAAEAIRAHRIAGQVDPGQDGDVHITADEPALDRFMATPEAALLFTKPMVRLHRVD